MADSRDERRAET